ncbi:MAG: helix-turn-helix transcriptional regulator [Ruminiclostridium sp.]|nr:helix-turn-helix transcriptional regulator [Ruminiclostridium sp.]
MWSKEFDAEIMAAKRNVMLEKGFEIFTQRGIEPVSMQNIADAAGCGIATLYRYFDKKQGFVIEVAMKKWNEIRELNRERREKADIAGMTAAQLFEFYLDGFLLLYREKKDLLRFNQMFNIYVEGAGIDKTSLEPYYGMIDNFGENFRLIYERAKTDRTVRTDIPETEMFSTTLHLMLAAVTRYAVGLVYKPEAGFDDMKELETLKAMMLMMYRKG